MYGVEELSRNRVVFGSLESILGVLTSFKIRAQAEKIQRHLCQRSEQAKKHHTFIEEWSKLSNGS